MVDNQTVSTSSEELLPAVESATAGLMNLMNAVSSGGASSPTGFTPPVPETLAEAGLSESVVEQLILKYLHFRDETIGRDLSDALGLKFSLIDAIIDNLKRHHLV